MFIVLFLQGKSVFLSLPLTLDFLFLPRFPKSSICTTEMVPARSTSGMNKVIHSGSHVQCRNGLGDKYDRNASGIN